MSLFTANTTQLIAPTFQLVSRSLTPKLSHLTGLHKKITTSLHCIAMYFIALNLTALHSKVITPLSRQLSASVHICNVRNSKNKPCSVWSKQSWCRKNILAKCNMFFKKVTTPRNLGTLHPMIIFAFVNPRVFIWLPLISICLRGKGYRCFIRGVLPNG